jgi:hypothetical protein
MKTTVFNCDKCGQPFDADYNSKPKVFTRSRDEQPIYLTQVEVKITEVDPYSHSETKRAVKHICTECLKNIGLEFGMIRGAQYKLPTVATLEDKIIDLLQNLNVKFEE